MILGELGRVFFKEETIFMNSYHKTIKIFGTSIQSDQTVSQAHFHWIHLLPGYLRNCCIWCIFWTNCFETLTICLVCINQAKHILFCSACSELSQLFHYLFRWFLGLASAEREIVNVVKIKPGSTGSCVICKGPRFRDLAEIQEAYLH